MFWLLFTSLAVSFPCLPFTLYTPAILALISCGCHNRALVHTFLLYPVNYYLSFKSQHTLTPQTPYLASNLYFQQTPQNQIRSPPPLRLSQHQMSLCDHFFSIYLPNQNEIQSDGDHVNFTRCFPRTPSTVYGLQEVFSIYLLKEWVIR